MICVSVPLSWIRSQNLPIDISDIEDLTIDAGNLGVTSQELDGDGSPAKVGAHGEVGNGGNHGDGGRDIMEDTVCAALGETHADEDESGYGHHGGDSLWVRLA